jgi:hypothetical protein
MSKRLKDIIKRNPEPAKGTFGVNPLDPWSAKAGLAEDNMLDKFLSSRGINPGFVSKDTKISHAKSSAFLKWKQEHTFESVEINEDKWLDRFLSSRGVDPKFVTRDQKVSYSKSGEFTKWLRDHKTEEVQFTEETDKEDVLSFDIPLFIRILELAREDVKEDMELHRITERLLSIRKKGTLTMADYEFIAGMKKIKEELEIVCEISGMGMRPTSSIATQLDHDTVKRHLKNLMAIDSDEPTATTAVHRAIKKVSTAGKTATKSRSKEMLGALIQKHHIPIDKEHRALLNTEETKTTLQRFRAAAAQREKTHDDIEKDRQNAQLQGKTHTSAAIDRLEKHLNKEETNKKFVTLKKKVTEAVFQDPQAATQSPSDGANCPDETTENKRQMSKSARMIKALYKNKNMKEDMNDWEKEDKSIQTYGKKPKIALTNKDDNVGENKPDALAVMSGGKTLTGQERDDVEIDPAMKKRPGQPDSGPKQDGKIR